MDYKENLNEWFYEAGSECSDYEDYKDEDFVPKNDHEQIQKLISSKWRIEQKKTSEEKDTAASSNRENKQDKTMKYFYGNNRSKLSAIVPNSKLKTRKHNLHIILPGLKVLAKM